MLVIYLREENKHKVGIFLLQTIQHYLSSKDFKPTLILKSIKKLLAIFLLLYCYCTMAAIVCCTGDIREKLTYCDPYLCETSFEN